MTEEEKRLQQGQSGPSIYGGAFDQQISDLYQQMSERPGFQYSVDGDALYQQYKNKYTQNAKRSMKDTMGKASGLTGGFGSTYSQGVGQQAYDETMRGLTDIIPQLEDRAYDRWQDEGDQLLQRYNLANQLGAADQATRLDQRNWDFQQQQYADQRADKLRDWDFTQRQYADTRGDVERNWDFTQRQYADEQGRYGDSMKQQAYGNLSSAILTSGYAPSAEELAAAGMTQEQANALRQAWIGSNPALAYMAGALNAEDYFKLTGQMPPGMPAAASGGGGPGSSPKTMYDQAAQIVGDLRAAGESYSAVNEAIRNESALSEEEKRQLMAYNNKLSGNTAKPGGGATR